MIAECLVVEFRVTGDDCPLAAASRAGGVAIDAQPPQLRGDGNVLLRCSAPESDALANALDDDDRVRYLHRSTVEGRDTYRCLSKAPCVVHRLTNAGFLAEALRYRDGVEHHTGAVVGREVLRGVLDTASETVGVTLERTTPLGAEGEAPVAARWDLTSAQAEALRTATEMGYFAVPREADAAAVAAALGIGKSAFLERLHRGQARLFAQVF